MSNITVKVQYYEHGELRLQNHSFCTVPRVGDEVCLDNDWDKRARVSSVVWQSSTHFSGATVTICLGNVYYQGAA